MSSTALSDQGDQDVPLDRVVRRVRRTPVVVGKDASAVFVTRKRPFVHVLGEVLRLLGKHGRVSVHGMGAAIPRAVDVALAVVKQSEAAVTATTTTSTVQVVDDVITADDNSHAERRAVPAVTILLSPSA